MKRAHCTLSNVGFSLIFKAELVSYVCYLVTIFPSTILECKTPFEVWSGTLADESSLRVFGYLAYTHVNDINFN